MRIYILLIMTLQMLLSAQDLKQKSTSMLDFDLKANHLVREQFYSLSVIYPVYHNFTLEAEYGYLYYHRGSFNLGYRFDQGNYCPYLSAGIIMLRENFTKTTHYTESCLKIGGGLEAELSHNFFFNFETSLLNYISINYSMRKIKFRENYDFGESIDYSVSAGIGYRFRF